MKPNVPKMSFTLPGWVPLSCPNATCSLGIRFSQANKHIVLEHSQNEYILLVSRGHFATQLSNLGS